jgi:hypothetical protein
MPRSGEIEVLSTPNSGIHFISVVLVEENTRDSDKKILKFKNSQLYFSEHFFRFEMFDLVVGTRFLLRRLQITKFQNLSEYFNYRTREFSSASNRLNCRMGKGFTEAIAGGAASLTPTAVTLVVVQCSATSGYASMKSNPYQ